MEGEADEQGKKGPPTDTLLVRLLTRAQEAQGRSSALLQQAKEHARYIQGRSSGAGSSAPVSGTTPVAGGSTDEELLRRFAALTDELAVVSEELRKKNRRITQLEGQLSTANTLIAEEKAKTRRLRDILRDAGEKEGYHTGETRLDGDTSSHSAGSEDRKPAARPSIHPRGTVIQTTDHQSSTSSATTIIPGPLDVLLPYLSDGTSYTNPRDRQNKTASHTTTRPRSDRLREGDQVEVIKNVKLPDGRRGRPRLEDRLAVITSISGYHYHVRSYSNVRYYRFKESLRRSTLDQVERFEFPLAPKGPIPKRLR